MLFVVVGRFWCLRNCCMFVDVVSGGLLFAVVWCYVLHVVV